MNATVRANGIDFAYLESGPADGPLALCLHGFPDHAPTYELMLAELGDAGFHAVAPWMRGYAPTSLAPDGNYQTASLALDACALADALAGDGDAVLLGHDWGAIAGYNAVAHRPERFAKLVAIAVPHVAAFGTHIFEPEQLKRSWYQFFFQLPVAESALPQNDFAIIDFLWREWSPGLAPDAAFMRALKDTLASPGTVEAAIAYYRFMFGTREQDPALADVQSALFMPTPVPTLYLHGEDDGVIGADVVGEAELRPLFPGGLELERVADAGHFLHLDQPTFVNGRIVEFLS